MDMNDNKTGRLDRVLDVLASRAGIFAVVGLLIAGCIGVGLYVQGFVTRLEYNHSKFRDQNARNGYVALSDIHRLLIITQQAVHEGHMTSEQAARFQNSDRVEKESK